MPVTHDDLRAWAARIRPHFEPRFQDIAEEAAFVFAASIGAHIKQLRPETRMAEIVNWQRAETSAGRSSLDWVETIMAVEEEIGSDVTDAFAEFIHERTFREFVEHLYEHRRGA